MREIKYRAWVEKEKELVDVITIYFEDRTVTLPIQTSVIAEEWWDKTTWNFEDVVLMQYTGLKDKNGQGCCEVYEGDIITIEGKIRGNIYENEPRKTDIVIPPIGTKAWNTTYKKTLERGFDYAE